MYVLFIEEKNDKHVYKTCSTSRTSSALHLFTCLTLILNRLASKCRLFFHRNAASDMSSGESRTGGGSSDHRLNSGSPSNNNNNNNNNNHLDPNTAAYQALRNHPETTIRPVVPEMRSPHMETDHSPRNMEESIFKQVTSTYSTCTVQCVPKTIQKI